MKQRAAHVQVQKKRRPSSTQSLGDSDVENKVLEARGPAKLPPSPGQVEIFGYSIIFGFHYHSGPWLKMSLQIADRAAHLFQPHIASSALWLGLRASAEEMKCWSLPPPMET